MGHKKLHGIKGVAATGILATLPLTSLATTPAYADEDGFWSGFTSIFEQTESHATNSDVGAGTTEAADGAELRDTQVAQTSSVDTESGTYEGGVTSLDAVTVTSTRTEMSAIESPAPVTVIGREEIERSQAQSLADIIKAVPGIQMTGGPRNTAEQPTIRGLSGSQVVVRVDGARRNFESGHRGQLFLDPTMLSQIDILRGPSSVMYGTGALGGVMNLETVDASDLLEPGDTFGIRTRTGYQLNNSQILGSISAFGTPTDNSDLLLSVTHASSDDYDDGAGDSIPGSNDDVIAWLFKGGAEMEGHTLEAAMNSYRNDHVIPVAANTNGTDFAERDTSDFSGSLNYGFVGNDGLIDLDATAYYSMTDIQEVRFQDGRRDETRSETYGLDATNTSRVGVTEWSDLAFTAGLELFEDTQRGLRNGNIRTQFPDAMRTSQGYFAQAEFTLFDDLTLTPAIRYDVVDLNPSDREGTTEDHLSRQFSAAYALTPWLTGFASYAEAFRAPSLTELYNGGTHFVFNTFVSNPDLRPEVAENKEVGLAASFDDVLQPRDALRMRGTYYQNDINDLIELQVVGGAFGTSTNNNVTEARIRGLELEAAYESADFFGSLSYSRSRGDNLSTGEALQSILEDKAAVSIGYRWTDLGLTTSWRTIYYAGQDRIPTGTTSVAHGMKFIHDLQVSWEPDDESLDGLRVDFGIDNVFDKDYQLYRSDLREVGRNVKLSVGMTF